MNRWQERWRILEPKPRPDPAGTIVAWIAGAIALAVLAAFIHAGGAPP